MTCWACGGEVAPSERLAPLPFLECASCGFAQRVDRGAEELHEVYEGGAYEDERADMYASSDEDSRRRRDARARVAFVARHAPAGGRLLDVGTAGGDLVREARDAGWDAIGLEPSPAFARRAREVLGVDVRQGTVEEADLEPESLDVVTLWHVLEHIPEPLATLERLRSALRPGGRLFVEVPNAGSKIARSLGAEWPMLEPEVHVGQYTPGALEALVSRAGLEPDGTSSLHAGDYYPLSERLAPGHLAHVAKWGRGGPLGKELLRLVAVRHDGYRPGA